MGMALHYDRTVNWYSHNGKQNGDASENEKQGYQ